MNPCKRTLLSNVDLTLFMTTNLDFRIWVICYLLIIELIKASSWVFPFRKRPTGKPPEEIKFWVDINIHAEFLESYLTTEPWGRGADAW